MVVIWNEFLWSKTQKHILNLPSGRLGYELHGQYVVFCAYPTLIDSNQFWEEFKQWLNEQNYVGCGYYLTESEVDRFGLRHSESFTCRQVGVRRSFESKSFNLNGCEFEEVRRSLIKGEERGLSFKVFNNEEKKQNLSSIHGLYNEWKTTKGPLDLEFFITPIVWGAHSESEKWVGVYKAQELVAFVSLIPTGAFSYYVDQMIFSKSQAKWSMNYLFAKLIETLPIGGSLDLGLCPLANIESNYFLKKASFATDYLPMSYNFQGLYEFKKKFSNKEEPCYAVLQKKHSLLKQYKAMLEVSVNRLRYLMSF
ncbi:MAG: phosphatidylglycerol lysyltransferase domain-containing protein [Bdellovibrionales bacterium]|nr:phosphatidylglycerol lysyltransferase domain-containing protein [Bdellovibrionales bacterium]